ncbi:MAG: hypothetical protein U5K79_01785 [Cyclobacteriaceae bacterium]|nr:hypothetical protein [Cyclobacteriaceae bacterium]
MDEATEDSKVGLTILIDSANQTNRLEARETIDEIGAVKSLPGLDI